MEKPKKLANKLKTNQGITLIALVISVVVLLILAGVSISAITGNESSMEKAKQARSANEAGGEEDAIKLAVVSAMSKGTYGLVEGPNLANELAGLVTSTDGIATNKSGPWTVQAYNSKIQYKISQYGTVDKLSGVTVSTATLNLVVGGSATLTATVSEDLSSETLTWHSTNTEVATVENGTVTVKPGATVGATAQIYAKAGATESKNRCTVTVSNALPTSTELTASGSVGQEITITLPANTEDIVSYAYYNDDAKTYVEIKDSKLYGKAETSGTTAKVTITGRSGATTTVDVTVIEAVDPPVFVSETETLKTVSVTSFAALKNYDGYVSGKNLRAVKGTGETQQEITVPAGFEVIEGKKLEDGMVIKNTSDNNEFVWVPVDQILDGSSEKITLSRYSFASNGTPTPENPDDIIDSYFTETVNNTAAFTIGEGENKKIEAVKKTTDNKGFYIGRYEMGNVSNSPVCQSDKTAWKSISRTDAIVQARGLYSSNTTLYKSDLVNSFAWDTAIYFIQQCGTASNHATYSRQTPLTSQLKETGKAGDVQCNIYDMAGNVREWTTERSSDSNYSCVNRGGSYLNTDIYTASHNGSLDSANDRIGFRPILYIM